jgi:hypothetical protein
MKKNYNNKEDRNNSKIERYFNKFKDKEIK